MYISVAEAHNRLSKLLKNLEEGPITITKRDKPVGVLIDPDEYARLQQVQAYLQLVNLSKSLQNSGITAVELASASREELEGKEQAGSPWS
jgi:prevent-host-death family protein